MKTLFLLFLFCASLMHSAESKPNVILIISDDHGFNDYGFMGHPTVKTPHLDRMAAESLLYTRGYKANRAKLSPYEMGIRTPMFVPGADQAGQAVFRCPGHKRTLRSEKRSAGKTGSRLRKPHRDRTT
jgi:hypothetical protein